jgi:CheY-like chemotaxis protein
MSESEQERVLVVDDNPIFRETLAQRLREAGCEVVAAESGERAFFALRDWRRPVDWLYVRAALPGLIDGWILADAYHDTHPRRAAIVAAPEARPSPCGDIILERPTPAAVLEAMQRVIAEDRPKRIATRVDLDERLRAA